MTKQDGKVRTDDYYAIAEELRRTQDENARLKAKDGERHRARNATIRRYVAGAGLAGLAVGIIGAAVYAITTVIPHADGRRNAPCYFVENRESEGTEPWEKQRWAIMRSDCSGCMNHVNDECSQLARLVLVQE